MQVIESGICITYFAYDAAGQRVSTRLPDGSITHYPDPPDLIGAVQYWRSLLRFDLPDIPAGAILNSAHLTLYCQVAMGSTLNVLVSPVSSSWLESNATWYNQPAAGSSPQTNQVMSGSTY